MKSTQTYLTYLTCLLLSLPTFAETIPLTTDAGADSDIEILNAMATYEPVLRTPFGRTQGGTTISFNLRETSGATVEAVVLAVSLGSAETEQRHRVTWESGLAAGATQAVTLPVFERTEERIYDARVRVAAVRRGGTLRPVVPAQALNVPLSVRPSPDVTLDQVVARLADNALFVSGRHNLSPGVDAAQLRLVARGDGENDTIERRIRLTANEPSFFLEVRPPDDVAVMKVGLQVERVRRSGGVVSAPSVRPLVVEIDTVPSGLRFSAPLKAILGQDGSVSISFDVSSPPGIRSLELHVLALDTFKRQDPAYTTTTTRIFFGSSGTLKLEEVPEGVETLRGSVTAVKAADGTIALQPVR